MTDDNDYVVCVPSYKRAELCQSKTLAMLRDNGIAASRIYVYVADEAEAAAYRQALDPNMYGKLVVGVKGLVPQRQFIMESWPAGKPIVFFDDDVASVDLSLSKFSGAGLEAFFRAAFAETRERGLWIWGVYPVHNPYFRQGRQEVTVDLTYIVGAFYGVVNRPREEALRLTLTAANGQKEDVERTLRYFIKDGGVVRFNRVGFVTKYYGKSGGLGTFQERLLPMREASERILAAFPGYGSVVTRKSGMTEFKVKKIKAGLRTPAPLPLGAQ